MNHFVLKLLILSFCLSGWALAQPENQPETPLTSPDTNLTPLQKPKETWRIGFFHAPPLGYLNESGEAEGFIVDLLNRIAKDSKLSIEWHYAEFPQLIEDIKIGAIDILPGLGYTQERAHFLTFSEQSFVTVWGQVFLPTNSKVETIFDLEDKTIALLKDGINGSNFLNKCREFEVRCKAIYADSYNDVFDLLENNQADAVVANNIYGQSMANKYQFYASNIMFDPFKVHVTQNPSSNDAFLAAYDRSLKVWKKNPDSYYYQTRQKWLDISSADPLPSWIKYLVMGVLLITLGALIAAVFYKRQFNNSIRIILSQKKQLRQIINHMPHLIYVHNYLGEVVLLNHSAAEFFNLPIVDQEPLNIYDFLSQHPQYKPLIEHTSAAHSIHNEVKIKNSQQDLRELMVSKTPFSGNESKTDLMLTVAVDVTETRNFENKIQYLVQHDELTGLANINLIREHLQQGIDKSRDNPCHGALLYIDIDQFKTMNEAQGHRFGDFVLKTVAQRLSDLVRVNDLVGRLSSDVFILHLSNLNVNVELAIQKAREFAEHICDKLCEPIIYNDKSYHVTACIGIALYPSDGERVSKLLQRADTALFEAKSRGRSRIRVFQDEMEHAVKERHELETDIHHALKNNDIKLLYQPILTFDETLINGWEALARWQHPKRGLILPDIFIPVIEQTSLMREFGYWVFEQVCKKIQQHAKLNPKKPFYISANLSISQLKDRHIIENINKIINQYDIKPGNLEIEITESMLIYESKQAADILKQLKLLGVRIAIDDFGTGYSSFTHLKQLPVDKIKIDQTFIADIVNNPSHEAMVKSIVAMGRAMNLQIVAEGVETLAQYEILKSMQCDYYQGFYFARPTEQLFNRSLVK